MANRAGSRRNVSSSPHNRTSRIDLETIGTGFISRAPARLQTLEETSRIAKGSNAARDMSSFTTNTANKDAETNIQNPSISVHHQPRLGRDEENNIVKHESPWKTYKKGYELKLDQFVTVAVRLFPRSGKVAIKEYTGHEMGRKIEMLNTVSHGRFVSLLELFEWEKACYAVFEHVFVSLEQVVACPAYPTERQLAAIVGQVSWH